MGFTLKCIPKDPEYLLYNLYFSSMLQLLYGGNRNKEVYCIARMHYVMCEYYPLRIGEH